MFFSVQHSYMFSSLFWHVPLTLSFCASLASFNFKDIGIFLFFSFLSYYILRHSHVSSLASFKSLIIGLILCLFPFLTTFYMWAHWPLFAFKTRHTFLCGCDNWDSLKDQDSILRNLSHSQQKLLGRSNQIN